MQGQEDERDGAKKGTPMPKGTEKILSVKAALRALKGKET